MKPVVEVINITKRYGDIVAVNGINLNVFPGECVALLGPNGAGKTTLCELMAGLIQPDEGFVKIFSLPLVENRKEILQSVGIQLQETNLYRKFTVAETLKLFQSFYRDHYSLDELTSFLSLEPCLHHYIGNLSGGQKQRVYLGAAMVNKPSLLFLDEPTTGLDPRARAELWALVKKLRKTGTSIVLTTHYMEEAQQLADRVVIMDRGKVVADGKAESLIHRYGGDTKLAVAFSQADEIKEKTFMQNLNSSLPWVHRTKKVCDHWELSFDGSEQKIGDLYSLSEKNGLQIHQMELKRKSLEDVFMRLTGRHFDGGNHAS